LSVSAHTYSTSHTFAGGFTQPDRLWLRSWPRSDRGINAGFSAAPVAGRRDDPDSARPAAPGMGGRAKAV